MSISPSSSKVPDTSTRGIVTTNEDNDKDMSGSTLTAGSVPTLSQNPFIQSGNTLLATASLASTVIPFSTNDDSSTASQMNND
jgi:hypothetical protein